MDLTSIEIIFNCGPVARPILSVRKCVEAGNRVSFHEKGGDIVNRRTGDKTSFVRRGGCTSFRFGIDLRRNKVFAGRDTHEQH